MAGKKRNFVWKGGFVGATARPLSPRVAYSAPGRSQPLPRDEAIPPLRELYEVTRLNNAVRKSIQTVVDKIFSNGYRWVRKFSAKCKTCSKEYPEQAKPEFCGKCGAAGPGWSVAPNEEETTTAEEFFKRVNINGHGLVEELKMFERHLDIADDGFLIVRQAYRLDQEGKIVQTKVKELIVADPLNFRKMMNKATNRPGGEIFICLSHRPRSNYASVFGYGNAYKDYTDPDESPGGQVYKQPGNCTVAGCGKRLYDVWYVTTQSGGDDPVDYFVGPSYKADGTLHLGEVIHTSKYWHSYGYGFSPLMSVYNLAKILLAMEKFIHDSYIEQRLPRGMTLIPTDNPEGFEAQLKRAQDINVSQGGTYWPVLTYSPGQGQVNPANIELSKTPQEMAMMDVYDVLYRRLASAWGVSPVYHGIVDAAGLQNQGPTQWIVTNEAATEGQRTYQDKVFPQLCDLMGIRDWKLELVPVVGKDDMEVLQRELAKVQLAMSKLQLGLEFVEVDPEGQYIFSNKPIPQMNFGLLPSGGLPGSSDGATPPPMPPPSNDPFAATPGSFSDAGAEAMQ